jgi:hypothetical protein
MMSLTRSLILALMTITLIFHAKGELSAQNLVPDCDAYLRQAEICLRETDQLNEDKKEALKNARAYFTALSAGEDGSGPRTRLGEQCNQMAKQLMELRQARSKSCTL